MASINLDLSPEDKDTLKLAAWGAFAGSPVDGAQMAINAVSTAVTHRSALSAAQDEYNRMHAND